MNRRYSAVLLAVAGLLAVLLTMRHISRQPAQKPQSIARSALQVTGRSTTPDGGAEVRTAAEQGAAKPPPAVDGLDPPAFPDPPTPRYKTRPAGDWDGMPVDLATAPPCESSAGCGLARACIAGECTACERDADCATGEACVLDHCVAGGRVACRHTKDCGAESVCVLSGYSPDPRGNAEMDSRCVSKRGGTSREGAMKEALRPQVADDPARRVTFQDELERARAVPLN